MASPGYPNPLPVAEIVKRIADAAAAGNHRFWPDDVSLTDSAIFDHRQLLGPKQVTDRYLLALAVRHEGRLVTFDQGIWPSAVAGASARHLVLLRS
jgi:predicted nucleic acid-binding protein